jgi:hypothetical protein
VVTGTPAWLGVYDPSGGSTLDGLVIDLITPVRNGYFAWDKKLSEPLDQTYATLKLGDSSGDGDWRPFTIVLTGPLRTTEKPKEVNEYV